MIFKFLKWFLYLILVLIIFALLPSSILDKIKHFFYWENIVNILKGGWYNLIDFLQSVTGIDFYRIWVKLKDWINIHLFWQTIRDFFINFFNKIIEFFQ